LERASQASKHRRCLRLALVLVPLLVLPATLVHAESPTASAPGADNFVVPATPLTPTSVAPPGAVTPDAEPAPTEEPAASDLAATVAPPPDSTPKNLGQRVAAVVEATQLGSTPPEGPDALYDEVYTELRATQRALARSVIPWSPGIEDLFADFERRRAQRTQLVATLSTSKRERVTGLNLYGLRELLREFEAIALHLTFQAGAIPRALPQIVRSWATAPIPVVRDALVLLVILLVFRAWRGWAPAGIPAIRERFLRAVPRKPYHFRVARILWYANEIRIPLEWLTVLAVLASLPSSPEIRALVDPLWMIAVWLLVARVAIRWINAFGKRRAWHSRRELVELRLRSLRVIAAWLVLLGLGLNIAEYFSGRSTLYAWTWSAFRLLAAPIALLLLHWWRGPIFERLENDASEFSRAGILLEHRSGLRSYLGAVEALVLLAVRAVWDWLIQTVLRIDEGRAVVSLVLGREIGTGSAADERGGTEPIEPELTRQIVDMAGDPVDSASRQSLDRLVELAEGNRMSAVMVTAARGGGKSHLLHRMAERLGDRMILVQCLPGGIDFLRAAIADQLDLRAGWSSEELDARIVERELEAIGVDDMHRLVRPVMGGQAGLVQYSEIVRSLRSQVLWCGSADRRTWEFIRTAGSEIARVQEVIEVGPWSESEIGALVDRRCNVLELELDFSELELPREVGDISNAPTGDQARFGFHRLLWQASEGNPGIALRYLADSLRRRADGTLVVRRPALPTADDLDHLGLTMLLLLRALVRYAQPSSEDLAATLRISESEVGNLLVAARTAGWIEELEGRYRVTWRWLPAVLRILVRKNLQTR